MEALPAVYARAAAQAQAVGFNGVEIHAGHGFLLSQFLSPLFNHRSDHYGGTIEARCRVLLDISGGTYFPGAPSSSDRRTSGPYFVEFARRARTVTDVPLLLTGGFKTRSEAADAISSGVADVVGLARTMVLDPDLPAKWCDPKGGDPEFPR